MVVFQYRTAGWTAMTATDGTTVGEVTLGQSGTITFTGNEALEIRQ